MLASAAQAEIFPLAAEQDSIGEPGQTEAEQQDTLPEIARQYHLGFDEIVAANPGVDTWLPGAGTIVRLPMQHLLPAVARTGIVINLPDGRLYYFRTDQHGTRVVETDPISVGKMDWKTPLGVTTIVRKEKRPTWYPPKSVRETHLKDDGDLLPGAIPPGPDNPLGEYAMRLAIPGGSYLIHGTNKPVGVGMQITHGCIRLYPEDIEYLFGEVPVGMEVRIVNQRGAPPLGRRGSEGCGGLDGPHPQNRGRNGRAPDHNRLGHRRARVSRSQRYSDPDLDRPLDCACAGYRLGVAQTSAVNTRLYLPATHRRMVRGP
jgi:L,D-transpeptidase ErfK/SrfK